MLAFFKSRFCFAEFSFGDVPDDARRAHERSGSGGQVSDARCLLRLPRADDFANPSGGLSGAAAVAPQQNRPAARRRIFRDLGAQRDEPVRDEEVADVDLAGARHSSFAAGQLHRSARRVRNPNPRAALFDEARQVVGQEFGALRRVFGRQKDDENLGQLQSHRRQNREARDPGWAIEAPDSSG